MNQSCCLVLDRSTAGEYNYGDYPLPENREKLQGTKELVKGDGRIGR